MTTYLFSHVCNKYDMFVCYGHCNCVFRVKTEGFASAKNISLMLDTINLCYAIKSTTQNNVKLLTYVSIQ